ncbi:MAG: hypothetical protein V3S87_14055 [Alphaproteobacteria bacterium]
MGVGGNLTTGGAITGTATGGGVGGSTGGRALPRRVAIAPPPWQQARAGEIAVSTNRNESPTNEASTAVGSAVFGMATPSGRRARPLRRP